MCCLCVVVQYAYSMRDKTHTSHTMTDDVPQEEKMRRLQEVITTFREHMIAASDLEAGRLHLVLIEGPGKKKAIEGQQAVMLTGKTDGNKRCMVSSALISELCVVG